MAKDNIISLEDFLNPDKGEVEREVKLPRFKSPVIIKPITEEQNSALEKRATITRKSKNGNVVKDLDIDRYTDLIMLSCLDDTFLEFLKDERMQKKYNGQGSQIDTLKNMLRPGEYRELFAQVQEINGFDIDLSEAVDDAKE